MSDFVTHLVAIGVGVLITLFLVGGFNKKDESPSSSGIKSQNAPASKAETTTGGAAKKRNRKKTKKKPPAAAPAPAAAPEPAPAPEPEPVAEPPAAAPEPAPSAGKKKKNKKKKAASTNGAAAASASNNAKPTPEPAKAPAPTPTPAPVPAIVPLQPRIVQEEAWETIPTKSKKKKTTALKKQQQAAAAEAASAETAVAPKTSITVTIDATRVGIIIGPKGATMNAIQEKTGTRLDVNAPAKPDEPANQFRPVVGGHKTKQTATIVITEGDAADSQKIAKKAILELADRGYATLLQADGFGESSVSVHPRFLSEIVGTGGKTIKAIQTALDIKLTIPKTDWNAKTVQIGNVEPSCRIGIAGDLPANVKAAKQVIRDLCQYHHHEITHPGLIHQEVYVPQEFFHCVIGSRGSEIKHIRGNYKVDVHMPSDESWCTTENVICVGKSNDVEKAITYIKLLMDRDTELREQKYSDDHFGDDSEGW
mmetsp:Transcript_8912/g.26486  ORF Transcript_8912/g.26486 Transcript_8912/m.26486 type:complete len:481 (-) Transcript_8912:259-1701(-)